MDVKSRKAEQAEATRKALLSSARELFAERGFADVPVEEIVRKAGVTKGALYHHFKDKNELFRALLHEMEDEINARVDEAAAQRDGAWERLLAACHAFLDAYRARDVQQIVILDSPSVLGWKDWCRLDRQCSIDALQGLVERAIEEGAIDPQPADTLANIIVGTLNVGGRVMAGAGDVDTARAQVGATLDRLLSGLRRTS